MSADRLGQDPVLAAIENLRAHDVSARRAGRLRTRCHEVLARQHSVTPAAARLSLRRAIVPALASVWCAVYLCEILLRAAAIYGF